MSVLEPLNVKIINFPLPVTSKHTQVTYIPSNPQQGFNFVHFELELNIEPSDLKQVRYNSTILLTLFGPVLMWIQHCQILLQVFCSTTVL